MKELPSNFGFDMPILYFLAFSIVLMLAQNEQEHIIFARFIFTLPTQRIIIMITLTDCFRCHTKYRFTGR